MTWHVCADTKREFVEVVYSGHISGDDVAAAAVERIRAQNELGYTRALVDGSRIEQGSLDAFDAYQLPTNVYPTNPSPPHTQMAMILPPKRPERTIAHFIETASINRGWDVRAFDTREEALEWLCGGT